MLGRFLELSLVSPRILESWQYYQRLGFVAATEGGVWGHPYAVVTDGRIALGLHDAAPDAPLLSYVQPGLAGHLERLEALGLDFSRRTLGEHTFNEALFTSPDGQGVRLLEARTYSMPTELPVAPLGWFEEVALPVRDLDAARRYWENLGFVTVSEGGEPWSYLSLTSDTLNIGLHRTGELQEPALLFSTEDRAALLERLTRVGVAPERRLPPALAPDRYLLLRAPEGTQLIVGPPPA